jgi:hypothetical protein
MLRRSGGVGLFQIKRIMWTILGIQEVLLGLRFMLKLIGYNRNTKKS